MKSSSFGKGFFLAAFLPYFAGKSLRMKKLFLLLILASAGIVLMDSCGPSKEEAVKYNDTLISLQDLIVEKDDAFINSHDSSPAYIKECHTELLSQVNASRDVTEKMGPFDDYDDFRQACLEFLKSYKGVVENEYVGMMEVVSKPDSMITVEDDSLYAELFDASIDKIEMAASKLTGAQEAFSQKYHFQVAKQQME